MDLTPGLKIDTGTGSGTPLDGARTDEGYLASDLLDGKERKTIGGGPPNAVGDRHSTGVQQNESGLITPPTP